MSSGEHRQRTILSTATAPEPCSSFNAQQGFRGMHRLRYSSPYAYIWFTTTRAWHPRLVRYLPIAIATMMISPLASGGLLQRWVDVRCCRRLNRRDSTRIGHGGVLSKGFFEFLVLQRRRPTGAPTARYADRFRSSGYQWIITDNCGDTPHSFCGLEMTSDSEENRCRRPYLSGGTQAWVEQVLSEPQHERIESDIDSNNRTFSAPCQPFAARVKCISYGDGLQEDAQARSAPWNLPRVAEAAIAEIQTTHTHTTTPYNVGVIIIK